ncbi:CoA transferase [Dactylosporangium sp. CA-092794]|uniref:CaiB/BaiF CoA-transferase family protein n=1 Tax=Dactylosporangium sp. CA-092794 TaxID=3239929 RepID=UPI003D8F2A0A
MSERWDSPLAALRVVEISQGVAAAWAGHLLAALGADVARVDLPVDPLSDRVSSPAGGAHGGLANYLHERKRRLALDLAEPAGRVRFTESLRDASVLVEDLGVGGLEGAGITAEALREAHPALSVLRLSPYGQTGPSAGWAASELTSQAAGGWVGRHGLVGAVPFGIGAAMPDYGAGGFAAVVAVLSTFSSRAGGRGVHADLSLVESMQCLTPPFLLINEFYRRRGGKPIEDAYMPLGAERCMDGWVGVSTLTAQHWVDACICLEAPEYIDRREDVRQDPGSYAEFRAKVERWLMRRTTDEVVEQLQAFRVPATRLAVGASVLDTPQWKQRPFFTRPPWAPGEGVVVPSAPWRSAPAAETAPVTTGFVAATPRRPLAGLRVLDLGSNIAVPVAGALFGTAGADVIKVESIQRPDSFRFNRTLPTDTDQWWDSSSLWQAANTSKRDLTLDLTSERGRELFLELVRHSDVVFENYSARVFDQFRLGYAELAEVNPGIILLRVPGYGLEGPMRDFVGFGNSFEQLAGLAAVTGPAGGGPVTPGGYIDPVVAAHVAVVTLAAIEERSRTGVGRFIELPQIEIGAAIAAEPLLDALVAGAAIAPQGNRSPAFAPQGVYQCADGWLALTVRGAAEWKELATLLTLPAELAGADLPARQSRHDDIDSAISAWSASLATDDAAALLRDRGVAAARVLTPDLYTEEPHLHARGLFTPIAHPVGGDITIAGWPVLSADLDLRRHRFRAPQLGEHNHEILRELVGLTGDEIRELEADGVIGTVPVGARS